jgi:ankyrin repeat protein
LALVGTLLFAVASGAVAAEQASLLAAAKSGAAADVRQLLKSGANPNEADADGTSALHWAVHQGPSTACKRC